MQCNINEQGRKARIYSGTICAGAGAVLVAIAYFRFGLFSWPGVIAAGLLLAGLFQIYEGKKGWCVVRAMGIKTRI
jgi:hypothetical protein